MKKQYRFTLIEMLSVIVILAIIALIAILIVINIIEKMRVDAAKESMSSYANIVEKVMVIA